MKYRWPFGVVRISQPGGICAGSSSKAVLSKEVDRWCTTGLKEWFGGPFRLVGTVSEAGDECAREWEISPVGVSWSGDKVPSSGGCLKNDGGSFRKRIGKELADEVDSGCALATAFLLTTWKSASRSLSESCRTWTTQLLFFMSIVSESCSRYVVCLLRHGTNASKSEALAP